MTPHDLVVAQHLSQRYTSARGETHLALDEATLRLQAGTFTALIGPSGCGKSTLLRILAGLLKPSAGRVNFDGQPLTGPQRRISLIFQQDNLMPWRTVRDNIRLPLELAGRPSAERTARVTHWLDITGLADFADHYPAELSGGMAQRVALARGLITEPDLLLLDEPFGALDDLTREAMWQELLTLWTRTRATVLMVTHSIREAVLLADRVLVMSPRPGHIIRAFEVPFARPRRLELLTVPAFVELEARVRQTIGQTR